MNFGVWVIVFYAILNFGNISFPDDPHRILNKIISDDKTVNKPMIKIENGMPKKSAIMPVRIAPIA